MASGAEFADALEFKIVENQMIVSGRIESSDAWYFNRALDKNSKVDTVVLRQMPGGKVDAMERIASTIEEKKLTTIVSGICVSACAHIFLAGEKRQFSDDFPLGSSFLGYHGVYRSAGSLEGYKGVVATNSERWYVKRSGGKLDSEVVLAWLSFDHASGLARFYHPNLKNRVPVVSYLCDGRMPLKKCKHLEKTALEYGIITTAELGHVKDTPHWKPELYTKIKTPVSALMDSDVISSGKKKAVGTYLKSKRPARAVVMSKNGRWLFWAGRSTMETAIAMAVLRCELKAEVKCHVIGLDDKLTRTLEQIDDRDFK
ncbi:MAG: hypothetical protein CMM10_17040 [Rhodospirillaceae bacterium]|nr:hypothetical protein [Rhodospirillaceae bacterium]